MSRSGKVFHFDSVISEDLDKPESFVYTITADKITAQEIEKTLATFTFPIICHRKKDFIKDTIEVSSLIFNYHPKDTLSQTIISHLSVWLSIKLTIKEINILMHGILMQASPEEAQIWFTEKSKRIKALSAIRTQAENKNESLRNAAHTVLFPPCESKQSTLDNLIVNDENSSPIKPLTNLKRYLGIQL